MSKQESIPVGYAPPPTFLILGVLPTEITPRTETPRLRPPLTETPLDRDPLLDRVPLLDRDPPGEKPPLPQRNIGPGTERHPEGTWDQAARQEMTSYRDLPPLDRLTDTCKTITLPQTSFAGGKDKLCGSRVKLLFFFVERKNAKHSTLLFVLYCLTTEDHYVSTPTSTTKSGFRVIIFLVLPKHNVKTEII